jgi:hypothetical protein
MIKNIYYFGTNLLFTFFFIIFIFVFKYEILQDTRLNLLFIFFLIIFTIQIKNYFIKNKNWIICNSIFIFFVAIYSLESLIIFYPRNLDKEIIKKNTSEINEDINKILYPFTLLSNPRFDKNLLLDNQKIFPLSSLGNSMTLLCKRNDGNWVSYRTDKYGFNNSNELWEKDSLEYMILGDSFSGGNCVNPEQNWVSIFKKSKPETINLAIGGNGPLMMLGSIVEYSQKRKVKNIIWQYYDTAETRIDLELKNELLNKYLYNVNFSQNLEHNNFELQNILKKISQLKEFAEADEIINRNIKNNKQKFIDLIKLSNTRNLANININKKNYRKTILNNIFENLKIISMKNNSEVHLLYLPSYLSLINQQRNNILSEGEIIEMATNKNFKIINLSNSLKREKNPKKLFEFNQNDFDQKHYSKKGYELIGKKMVFCEEFFSKNKNKFYCD